MCPLVWLDPIPIRRRLPHATRRTRPPIKGRSGNNSTGVDLRCKGPVCRPSTTTRSPFAGVEGLIAAANPNRFHPPSSSSSSSLQVLHSHAPSYTHPSPLTPAPPCVPPPSPRGGAARPPWSTHTRPWPPPPCPPPPRRAEPPARRGLQGGRGGARGSGRPRRRSRRARARRRRAPGRSRGAGTRSPARAGGRSAFLRFALWVVCEHARGANQQRRDKFRPAP